MSVSKAGLVYDPSAALGSSQDAEHERALFQLMGQLEQILVRLDAVGESKRLAGSIEIAKEILVELVEFSEKRFEKQSLAALIDHVCDFHELTKQFERMLGGQSWNGLAAFIGIKLSYSEDSKLMFQQLGLDLIAILTGYFDLFESRFQSREQATEWEAGAKVFLDDVVRHWNIDARARSFQ